MNVFQHLDELKDSDGVGNDAIGLAEVFQNLGYNSHFITRLPRKGKPLNSKFHFVDTFEFPSNAKDIHILHYGGAGYPYTLFQNLPGTKILRFHNVTPAKFYEHTTTEDIYNAMEKFESLSYLELASLSIFCDSVWCDSQFNFETLSGFHFKNPYIIPICKQYQVVPKTNKIKDQKYSMAFIGRFSPQKKWEDLITFFSEWNKEFAESQCYCIGSIIGAFDGYFEKLTDIVKKYQLEDKIHFMMGKSDIEVLSILSQSSIFVSMSEHEGFCLPILEAFGSGIPVFAYAAAAIPGTMQSGGKLFAEKNFPSLVQLIKETLQNQKSLEDMLQNQFKVLNNYNLFPYAKVISGILESGIK
ncbi:glycosyltransferase family 4 protein [Leptospira sp. WS39.C2]